MRSVPAPCGSALTAVSTAEVARAHIPRAQRRRGDEGAGPGGQAAPGSRGRLRRRRARPSRRPRNAPRGRCWTATFPPSSATTSSPPSWPPAIAETGASGPRAMGQVMKAGHAAGRGARGRWPGGGRGTPPARQRLAVGGWPAAGTAPARAVAVAPAAITAAPAGARCLCPSSSGSG